MTGRISARIALLSAAFRSRRSSSTPPLRYSLLPRSASLTSTQHTFNERGDTLVEVTIALAILAAVLTGAFVAANKAFNVGQSAKERSQLVGDAQQQAEALQSFRDSHTWTEFLAGNGGGLPGINVRAPIGGCSSPCFHMERQVIGVSPVQWVPVAGPTTGSQLGGQDIIFMTANLVVDPSPVPAYDFVVTYSVPQRGGGPDLTSNLRLRLSDLDLLRR